MQLADEQHHTIAGLVVAEADLTDAEDRVDRRVDAHLLFDVIRRRLVAGSGFCRATSARNCSTPTASDCSWVFSMITV